MKVLFQAFSNLTSINVDFVQCLTNQGVTVYVLPEHYMAKVFLLLEKLFSGYKAKLMPLDMLSKLIPRGKLVKILEKFDIIHFTGDTKLTISIAKHSNRPKVYTIGNLAPKEFYDQVVDYIDVIVSTTRWTLEQELKKIGSFKGKIEIIPWGVNLDLFNDSIPKDYARKKLGIPLNEKVVLWNDRMFRVKDFETFLEAIDIVSRHVTGILFYIKTRGIDKAYWGKYKERVRKLVKRGIVKLHIGWTLHKNLPLFYRAADVYVRTSIGETFGLAYVEALACGTPVIAAKAASAPEVLGDAAIYFRPKDPYDLADKIILLLTDEELRAKYTELGKRRARMFDWNVIAKRYYELYSSLMTRY